MLSVAVAAPLAPIPRAKAYLEVTERMLEAYADMMKKNPAGVIAWATRQTILAAPK